MKKIQLPLLLFAFVGILFSSCSNSSKLAITKRHYRSGYYVDFSKRRALPIVAKIVPDSRHKNVSIISKPENQVAINTPATAKPQIFQNIPSPPIQQISNATTMNLAATSKNISVANSANVSESPVLENKQTLSEGNAGDGNAEGAALSLLWIVIVVILILWLIGIIAGGFGLGGLINLLLLIALILFILWLLRIW